MVPRGLKKDKMEEKNICRRKEGMQKRTMRGNFEKKETVTYREEASEATEAVKKTTPEEEKERFKSKIIV